MIGKRTMLLLLELCVVAVMAAAPKFTLVIDAGHGGKDPGTRGVTALEKDINLKVALAFGKYVEKNCSDVKVIYTRKTDVFVELSERAAIANRNKADLFISIHSNALPDGKISRGFETYTLGMHRANDNLDVAKRENSVILVEDNYKQRYAGFDPKSSESYIMFELMQDNNMSNSVELAKLIQTEACALSGRQNKGVHQAGFLVLRETSMPGCLIELGFLTTPDEETFLDSANGQDLLAHGIFNAFLKYKNKYGGRNSAANTNTATEKPTAASTESKPNKPSKPAAKPATPAQPEQKPAAKPATPAQPEQKPAAKPATPAQPEQKPAAKPATPAQPEQKPAAKLATPAQPEQKPAAKPATPAQPEQKPAAKPATPAQPEQKPAAQPATPAQPEQKPAVEQQQNTVQQPVPPTAETNVNDAGGRPIFKVQIGASSQLLPLDSPEFKGVEKVEYYTENDLVKYTVGASPDFNEINRLRKTLSEKFPEAFVIAFRNGEKMDVVQAIREFRTNKTNLK